MSAHFSLLWVVLAWRPLASSTAYASMRPRHLMRGPQGCSVGSEEIRRSSKRHHIRHLGLQHLFRRARRPVKSAKGHVSDGLWLFQTSTDHPSHGSRSFFRALTVRPEISLPIPKRELEASLGLTSFAVTEDRPRRPIKCP